jgi:hypothetical protein
MKLVFIFRYFRTCVGSLPYGPSPVDRQSLLQPALRRVFRRTQQRDGYFAVARRSLVPLRIPDALRVSYVRSTLHRGACWDLSMQLKLQQRLNKRPLAVLLSLTCCRCHAQSTCQRTRGRLQVRRSAVLEVSVSWFLREMSLDTLE